MHNRKIAQKILGCVTDYAATASSFRRGIALCYQSPISPGNKDSSSAILDFACFGLSDEGVKKAQSQLQNGRTVTGDEFPETHRTGNCYFYPSGSGVDFSKYMAPSSRGFMKLAGWAHGDKFIIPFWQSKMIIGQIILDDPEDGEIPSDVNRRRLEGVANIAAVALRDACDLETLNQEHELLRFFADCAMTGLLVVQGQHIQYVNDQIVQLLGYKREELSSMSPWWNFVHPDDRPVMWNPTVTLPEPKTRIRVIRKDGRVLWLVMCVHPVLFGETPAVAYQFYDVTDRMKAEELLKEKALRDPLTGFRNRGYFDDAIQIELQRAIRYRREFTLVMADLLNFKQVNDRLGHQEGDRILAGIAGIIQEGLRDSDWVVRYGGDEFLLVLPETGSKLDGLISRLTHSVDAWCSKNCSDIPVGIDFGWATWTTAAQQLIPDLVREADRMLYERKGQHKALQNKSVSASADSGGSDTR